MLEDVSVTIRIAGLRGFSISISVSMFYYLYTFLGLDSWHMEVPRLGVELELQLPASTTATAMLYLSCVFDLHHSSRQHRILNPLSEARDRTCVLMDASLGSLPLSHVGNSLSGPISEALLTLSPSL